MEMHVDVEVRYINKNSCCTENRLKLPATTSSRAIAIEFILFFTDNVHFHTIFTNNLKIESNFTNYNTQLFACCIDFAYQKYKILFKTLLYYDLL
jgi:hypothetical protein